MFEKNSQEEAGRPRRISNATATTMIIVAIIMDLLGPIGSVGGVIIFGIWFSILHIPLLNPKQLVRWGLNLLGEAVTAGVWAGMTVGIILMIMVTRAEDKLGVDVLGKVSTGKITAKTLGRMKNKTLRRIQNPERASRARERLAQMREKRASREGVTPSANRQSMKDIKTPETRPSSSTPQTQNTQQPSRISERLRLIPRQGFNQEIAAPRQQPTDDNGPLNDYSRSRGSVENRENRAA